MTIGQRILAMVGTGAVVGLVALGGAADAAGAATVHRTSVVNGGVGVATSSGNLSIGDASHSTTSPGGTSSSKGTAVITTGRATGVGNAASTVFFPWFPWH